MSAEVQVRRARRTIVALIGLIIVMAAGVIAVALLDDDDPAPAPGASAPDGADERSSGVTAVYDRISPSVVAVLVQGERGRGEGSGVVWSSDTVVTNNHVVDGAEDVTVALASGERREARVLATDARTDLALLRIGGGPLPPARFARGLPDIGAQAIALGNPLGFQNSVTAGIVSGVDRAIPSGGQTPALVGLIQTDAPISPGNSGGALVNSDGVVIGINVAYIPPEARAESIGFAIPAPVVSHVVRELEEDGTVDHAFLGVALAPLRREVARQFNVDVESGAVVLRVTRGGPAADAGLRPGDVLVSIAGEPVRSVEDVFAVLRRHEPGDRLELEYVRGGSRRQAEVVLARRP